MHYKIVAIIPARGGSNRIPRKNIKIIAGKPMIAWTIEACKKSKYIGKTIVSTEDIEIKNIAIEYGAEVLDRPYKYATDDKGYELEGIIQQIKEYIIDNYDTVDYLGLFYPTSPLRKTEWIDEAYELMINKNCNRVYSAYKLDRGFWEECWIIEDGKAKRIYNYTQEENNLRYWGFPFGKDKYIHTADVNIQRFRELLPYTDINYSDLALYEIPKNEVVDINTDFDFEIAELLLNKRILDNQ